jgi:hypothetical protein
MLKCFQERLCRVLGVFVVVSEVLGDSKQSPVVSFYKFFKSGDVCLCWLNQGGSSILVSLHELRFHTYASHVCIKGGYYPNDFHGF